jgi:hypothetical protein
VKLYTPKGAARAMLVGKVLKKSHRECFWGAGGEEQAIGFWTRYEDGAVFPVRDDFPGLYEEIP